MHVNRGELHSLQVPDSFEGTGSFVVRVVNHGESSHVHVHLDDDLSSVASIGAGNHYVEGGTERTIRVDVDESRLTEEPIRGSIKVAVAYGASTHWIDVELGLPQKGAGPVEIDESLATPPPRDDGSVLRTVIDRPELPVLGLGILAIVVALLAALVLENVYVLVGSMAVLVGVMVALYLLVSG